MKSLLSLHIHRRTRGKWAQGTGQGSGVPELWAEEKGAVETEGAAGLGTLA